MTCRGVRAGHMALILALLTAMIGFVVWRVLSFGQHMTCVQEFAEIRMALQSYLDHEGAYPADLATLAAYCRSNGYTFAQMGGDDLLYVANLTTTDPENMPIVFTDPAKRRTYARVLFRNGPASLQNERLDRHQIDRLVAEPWVVLQDQMCPSALEELKKRVSVIRRSSQLCAPLMTTNTVSQIDKNQ